MAAWRFEDTFCAFLTMDHELDSLHSLGVDDVGSGPISNCAICCEGPEGGGAGGRGGDVFSHKRELLYRMTLTVGLQKTITYTRGLLTWMLRRSPTTSGSVLQSPRAFHLT